LAYQPIENHGIVGDLHTVALVGLNGSVDWLCYPHFDSPSVFAAILDDRKGGHFSIRPAFEGYRCKQFYWPETNVLITRSGPHPADAQDPEPGGERGGLDPEPGRGPVRTVDPAGALPQRGLQVLAGPLPHRRLAEHRGGRGSGPVAARPSGHRQHGVEPERPAR
jgi:hypothetical protein